MKSKGSNPNEPLYFLGIDGGGTKTHLVICDNQGKIIAEGFSGSSSIDTVDLQTSMESIDAAYNDSGFHGTIQGVFAGIGGIAGNEDESEYAEALSKLPFLEKCKYIETKNDVYGALASGNGELQGMALILGTGSVCFGINNGKTWRCGGYHYLEGDAGSAYDVGFQALKYYARVLDGRFPRSLFSQAIETELKITTFPDLVDYFSKLNRTEVAKLAPIVTGFGRENQHAYKILTVAAEEVRLLVEGVYRNLEFDLSDLVVIGGLGTAETLYKELYANAIHRLSSKINIISPAYTPAQACALLARDALSRI
ncbi:MAG: hypothetical protein JXB20_00015 [Bacilli bacterium]|nr:hypothetical protein [Bacilli bacterium]